MTKEKTRWYLFMLPFAIAACSSDGGSSSNSCDTVANANGPAFFRVENNLSSGLEWVLPNFGFGADMKPGECTIMGIPSRQITLELTQCNIGDAACTSTFGQTKIIAFNVLDGETYTVEVTSSTFN